MWLKIARSALDVLTRIADELKRLNDYLENN